MWRPRRWMHRGNSWGSSKNTGSESSSGPTPDDIRTAETIKNEGNILFAKGKYIAASEKYTEAIVLYPRWTVALVNRANCYKRLGRWSDVESDCRKALEINHQTMKAHYFLGLALEARNDHETAVVHLEKSYELARDAGDQIMDEIWQTIARVSYSEWELTYQTRLAQDARLKSKLTTLLKQHHQEELKHTVHGSIKLKEQEEELRLLNELFDRVHKLDKAEEIPSCFVCPLTMDVFRDPVISSSGSSYENSILKAHLDKAGPFDPITRKPLDKSQLVRNLNLRVASHLYLKEHPWGWKESM